MDLLFSSALSGGLALLVLLITCTTVSALLVGLAVARRREVGVRLSLGAPRRRLIRQLLTESVLMALAAAALGLLATLAGIRLLGAALDGLQLVIDWRVVAGTGAVAVTTGLLFGLSPALHATRVSVAEALKAASGAVAAPRSRLQRALVVAQIALTQPLLVGLGVILLTMAADAGRRATSLVPERIAEIELDTWSGRVSDAERAARVDAAVARVAALPGVVIAMPMQMGTTTVPLTVEPADRVPGRAYETHMEVLIQAAPPGYFAAYDLPIVRGRDFVDDEHAPGAPGDDPLDLAGLDAVILPAPLARRLWGDADPIGRRLSFALASGPGDLVVVGIVDEPLEPATSDGPIRVYVPYATLNTGVIARTAGPALPLLNAMRRAVAAETPGMPITRAETMRQRDVDLRRELRRAAGAVAAGGFLALFLAAIGLYAVVSLAVGQRTREIGIRSALGARRAQVVGMFVSKGIALSALGLAIGLPLSIVATRMVQGAVDWPVSSSPLLVLAIGAAVLAVASLAVWIPARRASGIAPVAALHSE